MHAPRPKPTAFRRQLPQPLPYRRRPAASTDTGRPGDPSPPDGKPAAASTLFPSSPSLRLLSSSWAPEVFSQHLLRCRYLQHRIPQQTLQLGVLQLQAPKPLRLRYLQPAILRAPLIKRRVADAVLATPLRHPTPSPVLVQYPDDLFLVEPVHTHVSSNWLGLATPVHDFPTGIHRTPPDDGRLRRIWPTAIWPTPPSVSGVLSPKRWPAAAAHRTRDTAGLPRGLSPACPARWPAVAPAALSPVRKPSPSPSLWRPGAGRLAECRDSPARGGPPTGTVPAHREYRRVPRPSRASGPAIREPSSRR